MLDKMSASSVCSHNYLCNHHFQWIGNQPGMVASRNSWFQLVFWHSLAFVRDRHINRSLGSGRLYHSCLESNGHNQLLVWHSRQYCGQTRPFIPCSLASGSLEKKGIHTDRPTMTDPLPAVISTTIYSQARV